MMKNKIKDSIGDSEQLEKLYRADNNGFEKAFFEIYPEISENKIADFWKTRLEFGSTKDDLFKISKKDILYLFITCAISGFLIKIPMLFDSDLKEIFYTKNAGLIVLFGLSLFTFFTKDSIKLKQLIITISVFIIAAIYINLLPSTSESHSIILAYIHLPLMIWCLYGLIFIDFDIKDKAKRMDYIKHNGDLAILFAIILLAGGILTGVTLGLFEAIGLKIENFYFEYIVISGLVSVPILATFIIHNFPLVTNKIAVIIANIFSPIVLITLIVYVISILIAGKDPYNDRDFLLIFNILLLGVMAIIVFSISEITKKQRFSTMTLLALAMITLGIDLVALSAILYRLGEYGFTPNRIVILGSNILIFGNLVLIMLDLYKVNFINKEIKQVELTIANYLPVYALWTIFVVFGIPLLFGLK